MQNQKTWRSSFWGQAIELIGLIFLVFLIRTFIFGLYQVPSGSMETTMLVGERFFADKFSYWVRKPHVGEIIACNDPTYTYSPNKISKLFEQYVWGPENWTKRIIAGPGDHVRGTVEDGKPVVYVNNEKKVEPYLNRYPLVLLQSRTMPGHYEHVSYDPAKPIEQQPFYHIDPARIVHEFGSNALLIFPGQPRVPHEEEAKEARERCRLHGSGFWDGSDNFDVTLGPDEYWLMGDNHLGSSDSRVFGPFKGETIHAHIVFRIWSIDSGESWWIVDLIKHPIDFWTRIRWDRFFQRI